MAKIPLRTYIKEIENQIERGEIEQAVAHAKNILKSYPKNIDTYRLLGKAYLESQHYSEAADILQRVLSVIPDDFISQIGMSIIREDEGNLDASIWHMERAYEVQPFNPAVQEELRRLYGRRDGIEPPKIRLTRGALVRMYSRGELYTQAIAETRAALAEDPQRMDLLVLLARLYYMSGQKTDAAEVCSELIRKLPYCLEANKLLAEFLPETNRAEEAQKFLQRIYALDPYAAFISPTALTSDQVPDQAVMVEQFTWESAMEEAQSPEWTRSLGVEWEEKTEEVLPDWLNTLKPEATASSTISAESAGISQEAPSGETQEGMEPGKDDLIPEWMKDAGWIPSDRKADEVMASQPEPEEEEIMPADLPDWVQSIAPKDTGQMPGEDERTDWLSSIISEQGDTGQDTGIVPPPALEKDETQQGLPDWVADAGTGTQMAGDGELPIDNLPDWFTQMEEEKPLGEIETPATDEVKPTEFEGLPDWSQLGEPSTTEAAPEAGATPDWLRSFEAPAEETPAPADQAPEWLQSAETETPEKTEEVSGLADWTQPTADETPEKKEEPSGLTDWLQSVESEQPEKAEESGGLTDWLSSAAAEEPIKAEEPSGLTDWLQSVESEKVEKPEESSGLSDWLASTGDEISQKAEEAAEIPDWLQSVGQETSEKAEEPAPGATEWMEPAQAEIAQVGDAVEGEIPDWLQSMKNGEEATIEPLETVALENVGLPADEQLVETPPEAAFEQPVTTETTAEVEAPPTSTAPESAPDFSDMDAAMAWLESLAAKQGADEATLVTPPEQRLEQPPDWVTKEVESQEPAAPETAAELPEAAEMPVLSEQPGLPEELAELAEPVGELAQAGEELPDWLKSDEEEIATPSLMDETAAVAEEPEVEEAQAASEEHEAAVPEWLQEGSVEAAGEPLPAISTVEAEIQPEAAATSTPDFSDMDAAMAWLESLAAKQGADEATLVTPPEQRLEQPPEWVTKEAESAETMQPAAEAETPFAEEPALTEPGQEQVPAWLEPEEEILPAKAFEVSEELLPVEPLAVTTEQAAQPEATPEAAPDFSDMDAAMAWLESLAAKQGADEATLVTPPEQRLEQPPEWVTKEAAAEEMISAEQPLEAPEMAAGEPEIPEPFATTSPTEEGGPLAEEASLPDWLQEAIKEEMPATVEGIIPVEEPQMEIEPVEAEPAIEAPVIEAPMVETPETQPSAPAEMDMDAAFAWLESLAEKQGADEGTLVTAPEERLETPPDWVQEQALEAQTLPEAETLPEAAIPQPSDIETGAIIENETPPLAVASPSEEALIAEIQPGELAPAEETAQASEEEAVPEWLSSIGQDDLAETAISEETHPWPDEAAPEAERAPEGEAIPDWLQAPTGPVVSGAAASEPEKVPDWLMNLEEEGGHEEFPKDIELPPAPGDFSSAWEPEVEISEPARVTEGQVSESGSLSEIQTALNHGDLDQALAGYNDLIQNGECLEETIHDLRDALYRYPVDISIWQTLGDAYARNNQLQEALEAYTKAEELLR